MASAKPTRDLGALIAFIDSRARMPHRFGRKANDCVGFVLDAVEAQTGVRVAKRISWASARQGLKLLQGFGGVEAAFDAHFERIAPAQAMRGDIGGVADPDMGLHPMIVEGTMLVGPGDQGNRRMKRGAMTCAWSAVGLKGEDR